MIGTYIRVHACAVHLPLSECFWILCAPGSGTHWTTSLTYVLFCFHVTTLGSCMTSKDNVRRPEEGVKIFQKAWIVWLFVILRDQVVQKQPTPLTQLRIYITWLNAINIICHQREHRSTKIYIKYRPFTLNTLFFYLHISRKDCSNLKKLVLIKLLSVIYMKGNWLHT